MQAGTGVGRRPGALRVPSATLTLYATLTLHATLALFAMLALLAPCTRAQAQAQAAALAPGLSVRIVAEIETRAVINGREAIRLRPADRVVPGDQVLYTLEIRNRGAAPIEHPSIPYAIPEHMRYVADSAVGPGADIEFSVDGGRHFDRPERLRIPDAHGGRRAVAGDYTHIRWQFHETLQRDAVAFARFRAVVK